MIAILLFSEIIMTVIFIVFACHLLGPQLFSNKILVLVFGEQTETVSIVHMLNWRTPLKNLEGIKMMFVYAFFSVNFCSCF